MPNEVVAWDGLSELLSALDALPDRIQKQAIPGALQAGCAVLAARAKELAPVAPPNTRNAQRYGAIEGSLRNSIKVLVPTFNGDWANCRVSAGGPVAYYARWVEYGTAPHVIKSVLRIISFEDGTFRRAVIQHPGAVKKPFMRPAVDTAGRDATAALAEHLRYRIDVENLSGNG